ncbi:hypothetical protein ACLBYD_29035 [Rhodococcus sp. C26F]
MEALFIGAASEVGLGGLLTIAILLVMFGVLVPRPLHNAAIRDRDRQIEAQGRRIEKLDELVLDQSKQIGELMGHSRLSLHIADEIKNAATEEPA